MAIAALDMLAQGTLAEKTLVATVMSNAGLDAAIAGRRRPRASAPTVGDKNVIDEMLRDGYNLGGEQSGHMIFRDFSTTGDGLVAALQILRIMKTQRQAALANSPRAGRAFRSWSPTSWCARRSPSRNWTACTQLVAEAEAELKPQGGRVLLRYSGTEPKARLLLEGEGRQALEKWSRRIMDAIKKQVGA